MEHSPAIELLYKLIARWVIFIISIAIFIISIVIFIIVIFIFFISIVIFIITIIIIAGVNGWMSFGMLVSDKLSEKCIGWFNIYPSSCWIIVINFVPILLLSNLERVKHEEPKNRVGLTAKSLSSHWCRYNSVYYTLCNLTHWCGACGVTCGAIH